MLNRILLTIGILLYAAGVPWLEINDTHVFNPDWAAHARLHNVWQLATNSALGLLCLWWVWGPQRKVLLPALMALLVTGGFMFAYLARSLYGGSMLHPDGTEVTLLGINVGVIGFGFVILTSAFILIRGKRDS
jgi:hypothetical protein